jgi:hypothetical protein
LVQLMNGNRNLRSLGSRISRRQSAHVVLSAETRVRRTPAASLGAIVNPAVPLILAGATVIRSISASGGASRRSATRNASIFGPGPSISTNTPLTSLPTRPARPRPVASE